MKTEDQRRRERENSRRYEERHPGAHRAAVDRYQEANREKVRKWARDWYWANHERAIANGRKRREAYPEKCKAEFLRWRDKNLETAHKAEHAWRRANPDRVRIKAQNRRVATSAKISKDIIKTLWKKQDGYCAYNLWCHSDLYIEGYHLDHVMPLALGGAHEDENLQLLCPSCNMRKGPKHPDVFFASL